jgi:hypothetical protein
MQRCIHFIWVGIQRWKQPTVSGVVLFRTKGARDQMGSTGKKTEKSKLDAMDKGKNPLSDEEIHFIRTRTREVEGRLNATEAKISQLASRKAPEADAIIREKVKKGTGA